MTATYNLESNVGKVRLLISDTDVDTEEEAIFSNEEIEIFLGMTNSKVRIAAAIALETMASNEAMVSKKIRTSDGLQTDGPAVAAELRARAKSLRDEDKAEEDSQGDMTFDVIDFDPHYGSRWRY